MSAKTGGNKKRSSQSDINYWKRAEMSKLGEVHKDRKIARQKKRFPNYGCVRSGINYGPKPVQQSSWERERAEHRGYVPEHRLVVKDEEHGGEIVMAHPTFTIVHGVITNVRPAPGSPAWKQDNRNIVPKKAKEPQPA